MIYLAADKHGYQAIKFVMEYLEKKKLDYVNLGIKSALEDIKLEEMIPPVVKQVLAKDDSVAILSCGTGIGVEVGANKFSGIRACLATDEQIAEWSKIYDKCNVLCLIGWNSEQHKVNSILEAWFKAEYDGDKDRLKMFEAFDRWN
jgi:ribose 5-phosphate isomerase B